MRIKLPFSIKSFLIQPKTKLNLTLFLLKKHFQNEISAKIKFYFSNINLLIFNV